MSSLRPFRTCRAFSCRAGSLCRPLLPGRTFSRRAGSLCRPFCAYRTFSCRMYAMCRSLRSRRTFSCQPCSLRRPLLLCGTFSRRAGSLCRPFRTYRAFSCRTDSLCRPLLPHRALPCRASTLWCPHSGLARTLLTLRRTAALDPAAVFRILRAYYKCKILLFCRCLLCITLSCGLLLLCRSFRVFFCHGFTADFFSDTVLQCTHMVLHFHIFLLEDLQKLFILYSQLFRQLVYPHFCHINYLLMQYSLGF